MEVGEEVRELAANPPPFHLTILYRGPLSSCNYGCPYCPFAKHSETPAEHAADAVALTRFTDWVAAQPFALSVFLTPWGEALIWPRYQQALTRLSHLPHTRQLAIQTNLSGRLSWLAEANKSKLGLWATYHPAEVKLERFVARCAELDALGVRYSVGVVGKKSHFSEIAAMRAALPAPVYLWVNAYKVGKGYYSPTDLAFLNSIDPLFEVNTRRYPSRGRPCAAGESVMSVDGDGTAQRCHFISRAIGNIYTQDVREFLKPRPCSRPSCECHIGYIHMPEFSAQDVYGEGLLARIPQGPHWADPASYLARARQLFT